jgi:hypothetical protein
MAAGEGSTQDVIPPLAEWEALSVEEIVEELHARTAFALELDADTPEAGAAAGLVIAIGNYECTTGRRDRTVLDAAAARLKEIEEGERSKYW